MNNEVNECIEEGKIKIIISQNVFYNPHTELNRDLSTLAVGALRIYPSFSALTVCDGMAASGIRGIRYAIENENVAKITFVDGDPEACRLIEKNVEINAIKEKSVVINDDINHHLYRGGIKYNFVELDPFGSPVPFIRAALLNLRASKTGILSVTATDTAVLCGTHSKACIINYGSKPMRGPICHEVGLRILLANIVRTAAPLHLGITPLLSFSKRHYMKVIVKVDKSAKSAYESMSKLGFVSMCQRCGDIKTYNKPTIDKACSLCNSQLDWAGELWLGELYEKNILEQMLSLNEERNYRNKKQIKSIVSTMLEECGMPPFYVDLHAISDKYSIPSPKLERVISTLKDKGFLVSRTHFSPTAIKTNARITDVLDTFGYI